MQKEPKYIDAHAHVNFSAYDEDREKTITRALDSGVWIINVGTQQTTSKKAVELAEKYHEGVYAIVGLHPIHTSASYHDEQELGKIEEHSPSTTFGVTKSSAGFTSRGEVFDPDFYRELIKSDKVVGIGECGLDYFRATPESHKKQIEAFTAQIELAIETDVPLMIHTRPEKGSMQAYYDTLDVLASYKKEFGEKLRGDFHFFAGDVEVAKKVLGLGFMCSFTGAVTFTHDYDEVVRYIPNDSILAETDCPYVTPEPYRGKRNEPQYVKYIAEALARIKNEHVDVFQKQLIVNTRELFALDD